MKQIIEKKDKKIISVDDALKKGQKMVNYPALVILFVILGLFFYLVFRKIMPLWAFPIVCVLTFGIILLYWNFIIIKWRLWAFENVRNVHELREKAIEDYIIWTDDSIFRKIEIRTAKEKEKWALLERKFERKDIFIDDPTIPKETAILRRKFDFKKALIVLCFLGLGVFLLVIIINIYTLIISPLLFITGFYFVYDMYKDMTAPNEPHILLNEKGIKIISKGFFEWNIIENARIVTTGSKHGTHSDLRFNHLNSSAFSKESSVLLSIDDLKTNEKTLNKLLAIYQGRYNLARKKQERQKKRSK